MSLTLHRGSARGCPIARRSWGRVSHAKGSHRRGLAERQRCSAVSRGAHHRSRPASHSSSVSLGSTVTRGSYRQAPTWCTRSCRRPHTSRRTRSVRRHGGLSLAFERGLILHLESIAQLGHTRDFGLEQLVSIRFDLDGLQVIARGELSDPADAACVSSASRLLAHV